MLIRRVSNILKRIIGARLLKAARSRGLLHPNQSGSLPVLSTYNATLTLFNDVRTLQKLRLTIASLFLEIKARFDNVDVGGLFLSNENTVVPAIDLLALVLMETARDRR